MQRTWSCAHPTVQRGLTQILPGFGHLVDTQMQKLMSQDITVSTGGGTPMPRQKAVNWTWPHVTQTVDFGSEPSSPSSVATVITDVFRKN